MHEENELDRLVLEDALEKPLLLSLLLDLPLRMAFLVYLFRAVDLALVVDRVRLHLRKSRPPDSPHLSFHEKLLGCYYDFLLF